MNLINELISYLPLAFAVLGTLAFLVSIITEVTKNIGFLKRIPTDLQVIILSTLVCLVAYFAYTSYFSIEIQWYYITGSIIAAFIVAFVAMYGWEKLTVLYNRFKK